MDSASRKKLRIHTIQNESRSAGYIIPEIDEKIEVIFDHNKKYYKVMNPSLKHYNFQYKEGLNKLTVPFNPEGNNTQGGFYFCDLEHVITWSGLYEDCLVCEVIIPYRALVVTKFKKYKTNCIILQHFLTFNAFIKKHELELQAVKHNGAYLRHIENQTDEICEIAVGSDGRNIQYMKKQTENICMIAVKNNPYVLRLVENQTKKMCLISVRRDGFILKFVKNQTYNLCKMALKINGNMLEHVTHQTHKLCLLAVKHTGLALQYVKKQYKDICMEAVKHTGLALKYVKKQHKDICIEAVKQCSSAIQFVQDQTLEICMEALKKDTSVLFHIRVQTEDLCIFAIIQHDANIKKYIIECIDVYVENVKDRSFSYEIDIINYCLDFINNFCTPIKYVQTQTPQICMKAILYNMNALKYIVDKTDEICSVAYEYDNQIIQLIKYYVKQKIDLYIA
jgi:hypothetical protein